MALNQNASVDLAGSPYDAKTLNVDEVNAWIKDYYSMGVAQSTNIREEGLQREIRGILLDPVNMQYVFDTTRAQAQKKNLAYVGKTAAGKVGYMIDSFRGQDFGKADSNVVTFEVDYTAAIVTTVYCWLHGAMPTGTTLLANATQFSMYEYSAMVLFGEYILPGQSRIFDTIFVERNQGVFYPPWAVPQGTGLVFRYPAPVVVLGEQTLVIGKKIQRKGYDTSIPIGVKIVKSDLCLSQAKASGASEKGILQYV